MNRMDFLIATHNMKKRDELARILAPLGVCVLTADEVGVTLTDVEETGKTFEENAFLKADSGCRESGLPCIADDSGLEVDALGGAPGVYSARYGHKSSDGERTAFLLENMKDVPDEKRTAKFVCVITCLWPDGRKIVARGECPGVITHEVHGENGFGYDPVFYLPELGMTYAELPSEQKNAISHRARALQEFCRKYQQMQEK